MSIERIGIQTIHRAAPTGCRLKIMKNYEDSFAPPLAFSLALCYNKIIIRSPKRKGGTHHEKADRILPGPDPALHPRLV